MTNGTFEPAELDFLRSAAEPGTVVMDVGANVGITTIPLATALAANGRVIACEPSPANAQRLRGNIERNGLTNVDVFETAISNRDGRTVLYLANDPAYHSIEEIPPKRTTGRFIEVPVSRLDTIWQTGGRPKVSLIKIDVEGAELDVLKGAERLIDNYAPRLVVETNNEDRREAISRWLGIKGYSLVTPIGFMPWNNVFSTKDSTN